MGTFNLSITAVGGHGCDRTAKEGELIKTCGNERCIDCQLHAFVDKFKGTCNVEAATLTHWPGAEAQVVDDLKEHVRQRGHF